MSGQMSPSLERLYDLLADRATVGIAPPEEQELRELLRQHPEVREDSLDLAAGAIAVALTPAAQARPASGSLRAKLEAAAPTALRAASGPIPFSSAQARTRTPSLWPAWLTAAAAIALAAAGWWQFMTTSGRLAEETARAQTAEQFSRQAMEAVEGANIQFAETQRLLAEANASLQSASSEIVSLQRQIAALNDRLPARELPVPDRLAILQQAPGTQQAEWGPWPAKPVEEGGVEVVGADQVTGTVWWNQDRQEGYMTFAGMPLNTPSQTQYQLWIIDPDPKLRGKPIDGGVFNIAQAGEIIIPINAKIKVGSVAAFAITVEPSGGVVETDQTRRVVVAPIKG